MQKAIVFEREMDKTGRLVIPIDIRRAYGIEDGDTLLIIPQEDGLLVRKKNEKQRIG
jgi:AbrB family looped-hinge helix DNA binding protein